MQEFSENSLRVGKVADCLKLLFSVVMLELEPELAHIHQTKVFLCETHAPKTPVQDPASGSTLDLIYETRPA